MWLNGKMMTEPETIAYVNKLKAELKSRDLEADNGARQIALYDDECRKLKKILALARSEVHRPYPEYQYRWEIELEKLLSKENSVYHNDRRSDSESIRSCLNCKYSFLKSQ